ncbi:MAG: IPT/TIG domain-containing protein [Chloroflexota bacterium]
MNGCRTSPGLRVLVAALALSLVAGWPAPATAVTAVPSPLPDAGPASRGPTPLPGACATSAAAGGSQPSVLLDGLRSDGSAAATIEVSAGTAGATAAETCRYIVRVDERATTRQVASDLPAAASFRSYGAAYHGFTARLTAAQAAAMRRDPHVLSVRLDGVVRLADTQASAPWGLDRLDQRSLPLSGTFSYPSSGGAGVRAYVIDTGIRASHADLGGRVAPGTNTADDATSTDDCNGHGTHVAGTIAGATYGTLRFTAAAADTGKRFRARFTNAAGTATSDAATLTVVVPSYALTVASAGTGSGTVASLSAGIACGTTCSAMIADGTVVTLAATPATGSAFTGWSGAGCTGIGGCAITMKAAARVTATFTLACPAPGITSFTPATGGKGLSVTLTGTSLWGTTSVTFNGATARFTVNAAGTAIYTSVPADATTGRIGVTTPGGTAPSNATFTVATRATAPAITSFSPASGPAGTGVTVTGTNLAGATTVKLGSTSITAWKVTAATGLTFSVPTGATSGTISVVTDGGTGSSAASFTATGPPVVATFTPVTGPAGMTITLIGTNLTGTTSVRIGGTAATSFTVLSATSLAAVVAAGTASGSVSVTTPLGTATSSGVFTVLRYAAVGIAAGTSHTCARLAGGTVACWGGNGSGQLGNGTTTGATAPVPVLASAGVALIGVAAIAAGGNTTCAVLSAGGVRCWGAGASGQLGNGTTTAAASHPVAVATIGGAIGIALGGAHACARLADGSARCWGANASGQLGDGTTIARTSPVAVLASAGVPLAGVTTLAAGTGHTCATLAGDGLRCWGANASGQLGTGTTTTAAYPVSPSGGASLPGVVAIACGGTHTVTLVAAGLAGWGANAAGQLGDGTTTSPRLKAVLALGF